jgi:hypothetical protein
MSSAGELARVNSWDSLMAGCGWYWTDGELPGVLAQKTEEAKRMVSRICGTAFILLLCRLPDINLIYLINYQSDLRIKLRGSIATSSEE